jgi:hypothetical protein
MHGWVSRCKVRSAHTPRHGLPVGPLTRRLFGSAPFVAATLPVRPVEEIEGPAQSCETPRCVALRTHAI